MNQENLCSGQLNSMITMIVVAFVVAVAGAAAGEYIYNRLHYKKN